MYQQSVQRRSARRRKPSGTGRKEKREQRRLMQLGICLALFLTVFVGKGVFPDRIQQVSVQVLDYMGHSIEFREVFSRLGRTLSEEGPVLEELGDFCKEVFGVMQGGETVPAGALQGSSTQSQQTFLNSSPELPETAGHYLRLENVPEEWFAVRPAEPEPPASEPTVSEPPAEEIPAVGTVVLTADYTGQALPEGYTMDKLSLGDLACVAPVKGTVRSEYGYRDHPIDGAYKFHNGIDLGADTGTAIGAFAAGTVEYVGQSDAYGNYFQLDHGDGIKSFYAHCSKVCVQTGQQVELGETVALVGSTGNTTGPHLHFELKCDGVHIDPAYYI